MSILQWRTGGRSIACALMLTLIPAAAGAQGFGAKGGVGLSAVQFDDSYAADTTFKPGFVGGGYVTYTLPWRLRVQAEALFAQQEATVNEIQRDRFQYFDVPVLLAYRFASRFSVSGGVVPRWLLSAEETLGEETFSIKEGVQKRDLAIAAGAGFELRRNLTVDVRYLWGREAIYRKDDGTHEGVWRTWQVTASYAIR